jgi:O-antigen ligase
VTVTLRERCARLRAGGPQQLAATLALVLAGFYLLPTSKAVNNVYYALVLAPALLLLRRADWRWLAGSPLWRAAMALVAYLTLSGLWTEHADWGDRLSQAKSLVYLAVYVALVACVFARRSDAARWLTGTLVLAAATGTMISAIRFYSVADWPLRLEYASAIYNANEGATAAGTALLLALFAMTPASAGRGHRLLWMLAGAALLTGMVLSGSRTPLVAGIGCLLLGLALRRHWRALIIAAALLGTALAATVQSNAGRQAIMRGDSYRLAIWQYYIERAAQHPWLGEGVLTDDTSRVEFHGADGTVFNALHPHDVYLATTVYGGVPALLLLLAVVALALRQGWALAGGGEPAWLLVLVFGLLCMLTDGDRLLHAPRAIWVYFWLPIGALIGLGLRPRGVEGAPPAAAWPVAPYRSE